MSYAGGPEPKKLPLFYYSLFSTLSIDFWCPKEIPCISNISKLACDVCGPSAYGDLLCSVTSVAMETSLKYFALNSTEYY